MFSQILDSSQHLSVSLPWIHCVHVCVFFLHLIEGLPSVLNWDAIVLLVKLHKCTLTHILAQTSWLSDKVRKNCGWWMQFSIITFSFIQHFFLNLSSICPCKHYIAFTLLFSIHVSNSGTLEPIPAHKRLGELWTGVQSFVGYHLETSTFTFRP